MYVCEREIPVSERAGQERRLGREVRASLTIDILRQAQEVLPLLLGQLGQRVVPQVGLRLQGHVLPPRVEEPDERGVVLEGVGRGQRRRFVVAPEPPGAAERGQPRGGGQPGSAERQDAIAGVDELAELGDRGPWRHRFLGVFRVTSPDRSARVGAANSVETGEESNGRP